MSVFHDDALAALPRTHPFEEIFIFPSCKHTKRTGALCARFTPPLRLRQDAPTAEQSTAHSITAHVEFCPRGVGTRPTRQNNSCRANRRPNVLCDEQVRARRAQQCKGIHAPPQDTAGGKGHVPAKAKVTWRQSLAPPRQKTKRRRIGEVSQKKCAPPKEAHVYCEGITPIRVLPDCRRQAPACAPSWRRGR